MNFDAHLPSLDGLKAQAKRLRKSLAADGEEISHSRSLELVARQHGYKDWNTIHAAVGNAPRPLKLGDYVSGRYLGQMFTGEIIGLRALQPRGFYQITIDFDEPVDVVTFDSFSAFRKRVTSTIGPEGKSAAKTSNGEPHMVLDI